MCNTKRSNKNDRTFKILTHTTVERYTIPRTQQQTRNACKSTYEEAVV